MLKTAWFCIVLFTFYNAFSQPAITWNTVSGRDPFYFKTNNDGRQIAATPDGGYIVCGTIVFPLSNDINGNRRIQDAWVVKYSSDGQVEWERNYGGSGGERATSIICTTDGGYLFAGSTMSNDGDVVSNRPNNVFSDAWVVKLSPAGAIQWQKTFGGSGLDAANSVVQIPDGYVFAGITNSSDGDVTGLHGIIINDSWVVKISNTGLLTWQHCYGGSGRDEANSIVAAADGGYVVTGLSESKDGDLTSNHGFTDILVLKISSSGLLQWQRNLGGNRHDIGYSIVVTPDGGYIFCGETFSFSGDVSFNHSGAGNVADVWVGKLSPAGSLEWEKTYGGTDMEIGYSIINDPAGGYVFSASTYSQNGDVSGAHSNRMDTWIVKLGNTGELQWQKCIGGTLDESLNSCIINSPGGYTLTATTHSYDGDVTNNSPTAGYQTWTVKLNNCSQSNIRLQPSDQTTTTGNTVSFSIQVDGTAPFLFQWFKNGISVAGATGATYTTPVLSLADSGSRYYCVVTNCNGSITSKTASVSVMMEASCTVSSYFKTYSNPAFATLGLHSLTTSSGDVVICGEARTSTTDGFITKLTPQGTLQWQLRIGGDGSQGVRRVIESIDHNLLVFGYDLSNGINSHFLIKIDMNGNIMWRKDYQMSGNFGLGGSTLKQDLDGSIYIIAYYLENNLSFQDRIILLRYDATGKLTLSINYKPQGFTNILYGSDFFIQNNSLFITGYSYNQSAIQGLLMKINKQNGAIGFSKTYRFNNNAANFFQLFPDGNDLLFLGSDDLNVSDTSLLVRTDTLGNVKTANYFSRAGGGGPGKALMDADGSFIWSSYIALSKVHPDSGVKWVKKYPQVPDFSRSEGITWSLDGGLLISGYGNDKTFLGKFTKEGEYGCPAVPATGSFGAGMVTGTNQLFTQTVLAFNAVTKSTINSGPVLLKTDSICSTTITCDSLKLSAPSFTCSLSDTIIVSVSKSSACLLSPDFSYDHSQLTLISTSSNLIKLQALKKGTFSIRAILNTGCRILQDSIVVSALAGPPSLDLGRDRSLCTGNSIILNAHEGYTSYEWQNGTTDSLYQVTQPGLYHVTTKDACGSTFRDSVLVSAAPPITFDIGPDRTKCNNDTVQLKAPAGFLNYKWSNNYNISSLTSPTVTVNPLVDTTYYVMAENTAGCSAYDSIHIKVNRSPPINLGADTSFCSGQSITLDAGSGFLKYIWSNGNQVPQTRLSLPGIYTVVATTSENCQSYDTLQIRSVWPNPTIQLDDDTSLCIGSTRTLEPGVFSSYKWQDGSVSSVYNVTSTGKYYVAVSDNNQCTASDTVTIKQLLPAPAKFLPPDTSMCIGQTVIIQSLNDYSTYSWNNNASRSSIIVTKPGVYWAQVEDANRCTGRDSIIISYKDCFKGFNIPSAFTPDNNGHNDFFKPVIGGNVKSYQFSIYNRWGQLVFSTTEVSKGWDGRWNGASQDPNTFVWKCSYELEGSEKKLAKGTVLLLR